MCDHGVDVNRVSGMLSQVFRRILLATLAVSGCALQIAIGTTPAIAESLRFHGGQSANDLDRVKVLIDNPNDRRPGPPADIGAEDLTIELWIKSADGNDQGLVDCNAYQFIWGNIFLDRDRLEQGRAFGMSLTGGRVTFSVQIENYLSETVCGSTDVRDGRWHHVAVQRRYSDGKLWLFVDGRLEDTKTGPRGDISYPDDGQCGDPEKCRASDPYLVFGAEKHDLAAGFDGWLDEIRLSNRLRYPGEPFPTAPFEADRFTVALYRFEEGEGDVVGDSAVGGASPGMRQFGVGGGATAGPEWSRDSPFTP